MKDRPDTVNYSIDLRLLADTFIAAYEYIHGHGFQLGFRLFDPVRFTVCPLMAMILKKYKIAPDDVNLATIDLLSDDAILQAETRFSPKVVFLILTLLTTGRLHQAHLQKEDKDVALAVDIFNELPSSFRNCVKIEKLVHLDYRPRYKDHGAIVPQLTHLIRA